MCVVNMAITWIGWSSDLSKSLEKAETNKQNKTPKANIQVESDMESYSKTRNCDRETGAWEVKTRDLWEWSIVSWVSGKCRRDWTTSFLGRDSMEVWTSTVSDRRFQTSMHSLHYWGWVTDSTSQKRNDCFQDVCKSWQEKESPLRNLPSMEEMICYLVLYFPNQGACPSSLTQANTFGDIFTNDNRIKLSLGLLSYTFLKSWHEVHHRLHFQSQVHLPSSNFCGWYKLSKQQLNKCYCGIVQNVI